MRVCQEWIYWIQWIKITHIPKICLCVCAPGEFLIWTKQQQQQQKNERISTMCNIKFESRNKECETVTAAEIVPLFHFSLFFFICDLFALLASSVLASRLLLLNYIVTIAIASPARLCARATRTSLLLCFHSISSRVPFDPCIKYQKWMNDRPSERTYTLMRSYTCTWNNK